MVSLMCFLQRAPWSLEILGFVWSHNIRESLISTNHSLCLNTSSGLCIQTLTYDLFFTLVPNTEHSLHTAVARHSWVFPHPIQLKQPLEHDVLYVDLSCAK